MFRPSTSHLRSWWSAVTEDILRPDPTDDELAIEYFRTHPHRLPLASVARRRAGGVDPRPAHCLTPVRSGATLDRPRQTV